MKQLLPALLLLIAVSARAQKEITPSDTFTISGSVKRPVSFTVKGLQAMPADTLHNVLIRNHRGEEKERYTSLCGIKLRTLLDSAGILANKPRQYGQLIVILTATDGFTNVYSWNELYNTAIGDSVYIITSANGKPLSGLEERISSISLADAYNGRRHLKALKSVEVRKVE